MSVSIYGNRPKILVPEPSVPDNYDELTEEEKTAFWTHRDHLYQDSPGYCYTSSYWDWRPVHVMIARFNEIYTIGIPEEEIKILDHNSNLGISSEIHCELLSMVFRSMVKGMQKDGSETVYMNVDRWKCQAIDPKGNMVTSSVTDKNIIQQLGDICPGFFYKLPVLNGIEYSSPYSVTVQQLERFADFLENCGGFTIK